MPPDVPEPVIFSGPAENSPGTALVGCGGTGCNILAEGEVRGTGVSIALSSEPDIMKSLKVHQKLLVDVRRLEKDAVGGMKGVRVAGNETEAQLAENLAGVDVAFIVAGLGGLTGGWGAVVASRAASIEKCMSVCVVSAPFSVEGSSRKDRAKAQIRALMQFSDCLVIVPNDMILAEAPNLPINKAFRVMNSVLASPVNLMLKGLGKDDLKMLARSAKECQVFAMDSAEWDRENAGFAVVEKLAKSQWLNMKGREPKTALLLIEGRLVYDDLMELGRSFTREAGGKCRVMLAKSGDRAGGLRVTAVVGF